MRVGLVGCGRWGALILRDLITLGCSVDVVARSAESVLRAQQGKATSIVSTIGELARIDGIVVATTTPTHAQVVAEALELGVPVFVEKPLTDDPATAAALAEQAPDRLFVMDKWRYHPGVEAIARIARSGEFGPLRVLHTRRLGWNQGYDDIDSIWVLLPHDLAIVLEIVGFLPDAAGASGLLGAGQDATLIGFLGPEPNGVVEISSLSPVRERRVQATFEQAVVLLDGSYADRLRILRLGAGPDDEEARPIGDAMPLLEELQVFVDHLGGGPPPRSSAREGALIVLRIAELRSLAGV